MKDAFLVLWCLVIFQKNSKSCRLAGEECDHIFVNGPLEVNCSGLVGCFKQCPPGSWAHSFQQNSTNLCKGCFGNPCENNAVCVDVSKDPTRDEKFNCKCPVPFFGRKCEKWGKLDNHFRLSTVGMNCQNPVKNKEECKVAARLANRKGLTDAYGNGTDLPFGCVSDRMSVSTHHIYWNPKGQFISSDPKIRQICKERGQGLDCIDDFRKIMGPDSCQVKPHSKPWIAHLAFKHNLNHKCGGVLIGTRLVLTAAHCICPCNKKSCEFMSATCCNRYLEVGRKCDVWKNLTVILGDHDLQDKHPSQSYSVQQEIQIVNAEPFRKWNGDYLTGYDVAILVLKTPATLTKNVTIAHLPAHDAPCPTKKELVISGWGKAFIGRKNRFLWAVKQQCVSVDQCESFVGNKKAALCVTDLSEPRNSAFFGDSGGPLTMNENGKIIVLGIASGLGITDVPLDQIQYNRLRTLYFRVATADALKWINRYIKEYEK